jgi:hypothetical protein
MMPGMLEAPRGGRWRRTWVALRAVVASAAGAVALAACLHDAGAPVAAPPAGYAKGTAAWLASRATPLAGAAPLALAPSPDRRPDWLLPEPPRWPLAKVGSTDGFTGNGWWWNAAEPGTGFAFEAQGESAFVAFFLYDQASGLPTWYAAWGGFDGTRFSGALQSYRGGQSAFSSVYSAASVADSPGQVTIDFAGPGSAQVALPGGRRFAASRYEFMSQGLLRTAGSAQPESGWWWNRNEGGRGYALEVQNNRLFLAMFHYRANGQADWHIVNTPIAPDGRFSGDFQAVRGGQSLTGAWRVATLGPVEGTLSGVFTDACSGVLTLPNGQQISIEKYTFDTRSNPCRAQRAPVLASGVNLMPQDLRLPDGVLKLAPGARTEVRLSIRNLGTAAANPSTAQLRLGRSSDDPTAANVATLANVAIGALAPGASESGVVAITLPTDLADGSYTLWLEADIGGVAGPAHTSDDFRGVPITVAQAGTPSCKPGVVAGYGGDIERDAAGTGDGGGGSDGGSGVGGGLGKVLGGLMRVIDLSDGRLVGEAVTDPVLGMATVKTCGLPGPFLLRLEGRSGARYYDEGLDSFTDFGPGNALHALVDQWTEHVGVSPMTEAAYRYAVANFRMFAADVLAGRAALIDRPAPGLALGLGKPQAFGANLAVLREINRLLPSDFQLASINSLPTPVDGTSGSSASLPDSRYGRSALVNGGLVRASRHHADGTPVPALQLSEQLARDMTGGKIDGFALDGSAAPKNLARSSYEPIRLPVAAGVGNAQQARRFASQTLLPKLPEVLEVGTATFIDDSLPGGSFSKLRDLMALQRNGSLKVARIAYVGPPDNLPLDGAWQNLIGFMGDVRQVSANLGERAYALRADGRLFAWGANDCGQLANGQTAAGLSMGASPLTTTELFNALVSGNRTAAALRTDGRVFTWGEVTYGLGRGPVSNPPPFCAGSIATRAGRYDNTPALVPTLERVARLHATQLSTFALTQDGRVYGWGAGGEGYFAIGSRLEPPVGGLVADEPTQFTPVEIPQAAGSIALASTGDVLFALRRNGSVVGWGRNVFGSFGDGSSTPKFRPTLVPGLNDIRELAGDRLQTMMALDGQGQLYLWTSASPTLRAPTRVFLATSVRRIGSAGEDLFVHLADGRVLRFQWSGSLTTSFQDVTALLR